MVTKKILARLASDGRAGTLLITLRLMLALVFLLPAEACKACFSIVVGKKASVDGYVIMGHNEDDAPPQIVNHHKITRREYPAGEQVRLLNGGRLDQVERTWAYIWSEMPGMLFSDSYINEWRVSIASNNCPSREDRPEITDGGIGYMLRRLVAERARTAREGVLLAGKLVERFGYIDSGRTYIICDPDEGWLFCVVNGKHWLAQRVPDDEVAMVANTFTVHNVDLSDSSDESDKDNFLASSDIITYAVWRGWYDPENDGRFDFAAAYANPDSTFSPSNIGRQWAGLSYIAAEPTLPREELPFSVVPRHKVGVADIMRILRHGKSEVKSVQKNGWPICSSATQTSFVVQLRRGVPPDIGIVYWVCLASPCTSVYIPFHFGIADFPAGFRLESQRPSQDLYEQKVTCLFRTDPRQAFWTFSNFHHKIRDASADMVTQAKAQVQRIQKDTFALAKPLEEVAYRLYPQDKMLAMQVLANYSNGIYLSCMDAMSRLLSDASDKSEK